MEWLQTHAEAMAVLVGAVLSVWGLFAKLDNSLTKHFSQAFATKQDFERLEKKVDSLVVARKVDVARQKERAKLVQKAKFDSDLM